MHWTLNGEPYPWTRELLQPQRDTHTGRDPHFAAAYTLSSNTLGFLQSVAGIWGLWLVLLVADTLPRLQCLRCVITRWYPELAHTAFSLPPHTLSVWHLFSKHSNPFVYVVMLASLLCGSGYPASPNNRESPEKTHRPNCGVVTDLYWRCHDCETVIQNIHKYKFCKWSYTNRIFITMNEVSTDNIDMHKKRKWIRTASELHCQIMSPTWLNYYNVQNESDCNTQSSLTNLRM